MLTERRHLGSSSSSIDLGIVAAAARRERHGSKHSRRSSTNTSQSFPSRINNLLLSDAMIPQCRSRHTWSCPQLREVRSPVQRCVTTLNAYYRSGKLTSLKVSVGTIDKNGLNNPRAPMYILGGNAGHYDVRDLPSNL